MLSRALLLLALSASCHLAHTPHRDLVLQAICSVRCHKKEGGRECRERCYSEGFTTKPGECDVTGDNPLLDACVTECASDRECPSLDKCCRHRCGVTCRPPTGLNNITGLPPTPVNVTLLQISGAHEVLVDWNSPRGDWEYVVEAREEGGGWAQAVKGLVAPLRLPVRPGAQLEARVAAVGSNGSRGFSLPSNTILLHLDSDRPPAPEGLTFRGSLRRGSVSGLLSWSSAGQVGLNRPQATRYTVQWSRRVTGGKAGPLQLYRKTIPQGKHCVRIKNLYPNSTYTFHVEPQVFLGRDKVPGKKATLKVDTSRISTISKRGVKSRPKQFRLYYKILPGKDTTNAKISWPAKDRHNYGISWDSDCDNKNYSVVITGSRYVIADVKKNCTYQVVVREKSECKKRRKLAKLSFKVP